ncbi:PBP1A family penicillin-binding protein [Synechocystis sp. LKSZ1]|uniref:PBP1A family penicillin-binding protein n=1 Tax=Synechocystis sp. LKSZ1 TaxID=3144951 RepID=UPI00336C13AE
MTRSPSSQPLSQMVTQAVQKLVGLEKRMIAFKPGSRVAKIEVRESPGEPPQTYPLLGERHILGRSSRLSDIQIQNPIVSQAHCSIHREPKHPQQFILQDEGSTNGIYRGRQKLKTYPLCHGDVISLGPPELEDAPQFTFLNPPPPWVKALRYGIYGCGALGLLGMAWLTWEWAQLSVRPWPSGVSAPVVIYAGDGKTQLNPIRRDIHRELVRIQDFSPYLPKAVMASEDSRFYWHFGVDPYGIARAVVINLGKGGLRQGASTLTQQVARSLFPEVGRENTARRKVREMLVALKLEMVYSKDEILKTYLNRVYLGAGNYGFEDAARFYFDKSAKNLNISEAATLVAMLPAPNLYNPIQDYDTTVSLRNRVIKRMANLGMISATEAQQARRSPITVSPKARQSLSKLQAPYFYSYIFTELQNLLGEEVAKEGNFIVESTVNLEAQRQAETQVKQYIANEGQQFRFSQGALVTLDSHNGEILALVGGADYKSTQFNRATQALRQPGSTFKIFAYAAALEAGISAYQTYSCAGIRWQGQAFRPCERSSGNITLAHALAQSENAVALRVAQQVGLDRIATLAEDLGIRSPLHKNPGLVLGQSEVRLLELTGAYGVIADQGQWHLPHAIRRIRDGNDCQDSRRHQTCREIYSATQMGQASVPVLKASTASTLVTLLQNAVNGGTGQAASIGYGAAGKTGTTNRGVDLLFVGFLPQQHFVTGIWLGNDDNSPTRGSSAQAARLWGRYMKTLVQ